MTKTKMHLFEGVGIEIEYMVVKNDTLAVMPVVDKLLLAEGQSYGDLIRGSIGWSNELALHVLELKVAQPTTDVAGLLKTWQENIVCVNKHLHALGGKLMPTAMHPWMDPSKETQLWPHEGADIYKTFHDIFNCNSHGWSNLQSIHINLPFAGDEEFGRLHAACRLVLPLLPALAASSPLMDARLQRFNCTRLHIYQDNAIRFPSITGQIIPEAVFNRKDYEMNILAKIYYDLAEEEKASVLQHEWVNARGAIARFDRDSIEIRVLDTQECLLADLAIVVLVTALIKAMTQERWISYKEQTLYSHKNLAAILRPIIVEGEQTVIKDTAFLKAFGITQPSSTVQEIWQKLAEDVLPQASNASWYKALQVIFKYGNLSSRIAKILQKDSSKQQQRQIYNRLCECLAKNEMFVP